VARNFYHVLLLRLWEVLAADVGRAGEESAYSAAPEGSDIAS
jgi:hypothetical protein